MNTRTLLTNLFSEVRYIFEEEK